MEQSRPHGKRVLCEEWQKNVLICLTNVPMLGFTMSPDVVGVDQEDVPRNKRNHGAGNVEKLNGYLQHLQKYTGQIQVPNTNFVLLPSSFDP